MADRDEQAELVGNLHKQRAELETVRAGMVAKLDSLRAQFSATKTALDEIEWKLQFIHSLIPPATGGAQAEVVLRPIMAKIKPNVGLVVDALEDGEASPIEITERIHSQRGDEAISYSKVIDVLRKNPDLFENPRRGVWKLAYQRKEGGR